VWKLCGGVVKVVGACETLEDISEVAAKGRSQRLLLLALEGRSNGEQARVADEKRRPPRFAMLGLLVWLCFGVGQP